MKKEILQGEFYPSQKSKKRVTIVIIENTRQIDQQKITDFLTKLTDGRITIATYKNAVIDNKKTL